VLDVKVGSGAFMKSEADARELARTMVEIGTAHGVKTVALLTQMSTPLGRAVGNGIEVEESLEVLAGGGPPDVVELTLALAREMLACAGLSTVDPEAALRDGRAMDSWRALIRAQGGDPDAPIAQASEREQVRATRDGFVVSVDAYAIGVAAWRLGAGRARKEDPVSPTAGVMLHRRPGEPVKKGDVLYELRTDDASRMPAGLSAAKGAVKIAKKDVTPVPLILERVGGEHG
jgi:thymidine phosphorylase